MQKLLDMVKYIFMSTELGQERGFFYPEGIFKTSKVFHLATDLRIFRIVILVINPKSVTAQGLKEFWETMDHVFLPVQY